MLLFVTSIEIEGNNYKSTVECAKFNDKDNDLRVMKEIKKHLLHFLIKFEPLYNFF